MKKIRLVLTGNPGVGKHTAATIIAKRLGSEIIDINKAAIDGHAISKKTDLGLDVNVVKLRSLLARTLKSKNNFIVVGHLAPYVLKSAGIDRAAVLRRSPYQLEMTLEKRGYDVAKVRENVCSEILGVSFYDAMKTFGKRKVVEFDTTGKTPVETADEIISALHHRTPRRKTPDWLMLVSERGDTQRFFQY